MALEFLVFFPLFVGSTLELDNITVSQGCEEDTNTFLWELNQEAPQEYAVLMYDAFGRRGSNVKGGNVHQLGMLEECHSAHGPTFSGQYCQVFLDQGTLQYFLGICVPDSCDQEDVKFLVLNDSFQIGQTSLTPSIPSILVGQTNLQGISSHCSAKAITPDAFQIVCLVLCCIMVLIPLGATLTTAITRWRRNREASRTQESSPMNTELSAYGTMKSTDSSSENKSPSEQNKSNNNVLPPQLCMDNFLQACSLQNTCRGVLSTSSSIPAGGFSTLSGIRALSLLWSLCGHTELGLGSSITDNFITWQQEIHKTPFYLAGDGPFSLCVDSFFVLSGILSVRSLICASKKADGKLSTLLIAKYVLNRIRRIQPLHVFIICLCNSLYSLVLWGPNWKTAVLSFDCKPYWWTHVLLLHNFISVSYRCGWTWYLATDFQCYLTTPLLVYLYKLNRVVFAAVVGVLLLLTIGSGAYALGHLPPSGSIDSSPYFSHYYVKPYTRYGPFLIGILTGLYLVTKDDQLINLKKAAVGWICCVSLMTLVAVMSYLQFGSPPSVPLAIYQASHRTLFALALAWIIIACKKGYGGFIKSFLSLGIWVPISNIGFAFYLLSPIVAFSYVSLQETVIHASYINAMFIFIGNLVLTLVLSYVLTVLIEKPYFVKCNLS